MGASRLLQLLARLSELRVLELDEVGGSKWPEQLSLHSAITASSNLQKLVVRAGIETEGWKHVFSAGRKLPHLRTLVALDRMVFDIETQCLSALSPETLACLGSCCPVLEQLAFIASHPLAALQSLTAVTKLEVKQAKNAVVGDLTALTQLQDLMLTASLGCAEEMEFTLRHLLPLIALTGLTHLECPADWDLEQEYEHVFGDDVSSVVNAVQVQQHMLQWAFRLSWVLPAWRDQSVCSCQQVLMCCCQTAIPVLTVPAFLCPAFLRPCVYVTRPLQVRHPTCGCSSWSTAYNTTLCS